RAGAASSGGGAAGRRDRRPDRGADGSAQEPQLRAGRRNSGSVGGEGHPARRHGARHPLAAQMTEVSKAAVIAPLLPDRMPAHQMNPIVLAYIGDAVFEVFVRQHLIATLSRKPHELHRAATRYVSAAAQAKLLQRWMPLLTEEEADIAR